jgi:hypothetical protein
MAEHTKHDAWRAAHMETMAGASLDWSMFSGESRLAWVLERGRRVPRDAVGAGRVPRVERARNNAGAPRVLIGAEQAKLGALGDNPLMLDDETIRVVALLEHDAPPPQVLHDLALSPLTIRGGGGRSRRDG